MRYILVLLLLTGCTSQGVLPIYSDIPDTCEDIHEEMERLDNELKDILGQRAIKDTAIAGSQVAVAAGAVTPALALVPLVLQSIRYDNGERWARIDYLATVKEIRGCK